MRTKARNTIARVLLMLGGTLLIVGVAVGILGIFVEVL